MYPSVPPGGLIWAKTANPSSGQDEARGVAADGSGFYIVGYGEKPGEGRWRIEKRDLATGSLIWKKTSNPSSSGDEAYSVAVDGTGVYIVGFDRKPGNLRWRVEKRSLSTGSLLWKKTSNPSSGIDMAYGVAVDGSGVYIVGYDEKPGEGRWRMEKRSPVDGSLLWAKTSNPSSGPDEARGVAVDGSGVYIVGYDSKLGNSKWRIEKRNLADGSLIWKKTCNPSSGGDAANGVAVDGTGVYIMGFDSKPGVARWRMEKRDLADGSLIWKKFSNPSSSPDVAQGLAIDGSGVYIVGYDRKLGNSKWRIEKRDLASGSLTWMKTSNPSSGTDVAYGVAVDGTGIYIVGYDNKPGNRRWRMEKRYP